MESDASAAARSAGLIEKLHEFVGRGGESVAVARDRITAEGIRQMTDISGDRNPVYGDADFAAASVHGALVAPPMSVLSWSLKAFHPVPTANWLGDDGVPRYRLDPNPAREAGASGAQRPYGILSDILELLAEAGYTSPAVTNGEYVFHRYPRAGDLLSIEEPVIESIVGPKTTSLGEGYFITQSQRVLDEGGAEICVMRHSSIAFKPPA